jgi:hypothetical protein
VDRREGTHHEPVLFDEGRRGQGEVVLHLEQRL